MGSRIQTLASCGHKYFTSFSMKPKSTRVYDGCKKEESHCKCCKKSTKKRIFKRYVYKCSQCDYKTIGIAAKKRHMDNNHGLGTNKQLIKCEVCGFETTTAAGLQLHMYKAHGTRNLDEGKQNPKLSEHITKWGGKMKECQECGYKTDKGQIKFNEHKCEALRCEWCDFKSNSVNTVNLHRKKMHLEEVKKIVFSCDICSYKSNRKFNIKKHEEIVHKGFKMICQHCAKNVTQESDLNKHIESVHGIKTVGARSKDGSTVCKKCGFKTKPSRAIAMKTHSCDLLKCSLCEFETRFEVQMNRHMKVTGHYLQKE